MQEGPIVKKSLQFSIVIIDYCDLLNERRKFIRTNAALAPGLFFYRKFKRIIRL